MNNYYKQAIVELEKSIKKLEKSIFEVGGNEDLDSIVVGIKNSVDLISVGGIFEGNSKKDCSHETIISKKKWCSAVHIRFTAICQDCLELEVLEASFESGITEEQEREIVFDLEKKLGGESV